MAKYKVVFENDDIVVSRDDEDNYRVEFFEDYHWKDEYFFYKKKLSEPKVRPYQPYTITTNGTTYAIPKCCEGCANHPSNGGNGICNCSLPDYERMTEFFNC